MKWKLTLVAGVLALAAIIAWATLLRKPTVLLMRVPPQNAYDTFLAAEDDIDPKTDWWNEVDETELDRIVAANAATVAKMRAALDRESVVPVAALEANVDPIQTGIDRVSDMTRVGRALLAEYRHAELAGDIDGQLAIAGDILRFSQAVARGGLTIDHLKGAAYTSSALERLSTLAPQLDAKEVRGVLRQLDAAAFPVEDAANVVNRDISFIMSQKSVGDRLMLSQIVNAERQRSIKALSDSQVRVAAEVAALKLRLGLRLFQLENDRLPLKLVELVPEYLPELPVDPATGEPFFYEPGDDGAYLLHRPAASDLEEQP